MRAFPLTARAQSHRSMEGRIALDECLSLCAYWHKLNKRHILEVDNGIAKPPCED